MKRLLDLFRSLFKPVESQPVLTVQPKLLLDSIIPKEQRTRAWKGIVLHHSATVDGKINDWEVIRRYHTSYRIDGNIVTAEEFKKRKTANQGKRFEEPWSAIGYHLGLELVGEELQICRGRSLMLDGAHATGFNKTHIGICLIGNYDLKSPNSDQYFLLVKICRELQAIYSIPTSAIIGHRETYPLLGKPVEKSCPGTKFDLTAFRAII